MIWPWILAYLIAGEGFVAKDASEPGFNQPAYVRTKKGRWLVRLLWPFVSLRMLILHIRRSSGKLRHKFIGGHFLPTWFFFLAIGAIGTLLMNWLFD